MTVLKWQSRPSGKSFNNLIDDVFSTVPSLIRDEFVAPIQKFLVPVNVKETETEFQLEVVAPGFDKEDFQISLDNNLLTVSAGTEEETEQDKQTYIRKEYKRQAFKRSFTVDEKIDAQNIVAKYLNGVLTLNLPKKSEVKPSAKEITIQ